MDDKSRLQFIFELSSSQGMRGSRAGYRVTKLGLSEDVLGSGFKKTKLRKFESKAIKSFIDS